MLFTKINRGQNRCIDWRTEPRLIFRHQRKQGSS